MSPSTLLEVLIILLYIIKVTLLIWFVPLRYYFKAYFSETESHIPEMQLLRRYLRIFRKVQRHLPFKLTCLVKSMVLFDILKRHGMVNPIRLGIRIEGNMKAHAWNDHHVVADFKTII